MEQVSTLLFEDIITNINLLKGIYGYGYEYPTKVQSYAIQKIMDKKDCIIQDKSGSGKTITFIIGSLNIIEEDKYFTQVVIINPTKILAEQTYTITKELSKYINVDIALHIGGIRKNLYIKEKRNKCNENILYNEQIIICTPGRLVDLLKNKLIFFDNLKLLVIDEADELFKKGFIDDIKFICQQTNENITSITLFSATMPIEILNLCEIFMSDAEKYLLEEEEIKNDKILQYYINVEEEKNKLKGLIDIYKENTILQSIIYTNTKQNCE